ncbi:MAG TPA: hypothetical protein PKE55_04785 [Kiritimatiellia bacterium]|nr:hypothetical protein [Kiritimatiellia bacterium]
MMMMTRKWMIRLALGLGLVWSGGVAPASGQEDFGDLASMMQAMMQGGTNKPVNFRAIRDWMPGTLAGMERQSAKGERTSAMGMTISFAEAEYGGAEGSFYLKVTDISALGQMAQLAQMGWMHMDLDRETDTEIERTTTINGRRAMERFNSVRSEGEIQLFDSERFMIELRGFRVDLDMLRKALGELDLEGLAALEPDA